MMKKQWLALLILFLFLVLVFQGIIPTPLTEENKSLIYEERESQLSAYSDDWNGLSNFRKLIEEQEDYQVATIISNPLILKKLPKPQETLFVSIGVEKRYDPVQVEVLLEFVKQGGRILLMDDFGQADSLSKKFGISFTGKKIWSKEFEKNISFIKREIQFEEKRYTLLFNAPSVLIEVEDTIFETEVLLTTTEETWIDENKNGKLEMYEGDVQRKDPMVIEASLSHEPRVICVADASLFINDMLEKEDNKAFALALVRHLLPNGTVIFDESRHIQDSVIENAVYTFENGYIYFIHIFLVTSGSSQTVQTVLLVLKFIVIGVMFYVFFLFYAATKNPKRYRSFYDPTYRVKYQFGGLNRQWRLYHLLNSVLQERYGLIFVDAEHVYHESTKQIISLRDKKVLKKLLGDPILEKFYLRPDKGYSLEKITEVYNHIMAMKK